MNGMVSSTIVREAWYACLHFNHCFEILSARILTCIRLWFNFGCISKGISFPLRIKFIAFEPHSSGIVPKECPLKMDNMLCALLTYSMYALSHDFIHISSLNKRPCFLAIWWKKSITKELILFLSALGMWLEKIKTNSKWENFLCLGRSF